MKCPLCGEELRRSKKDPSYGLCDSCRKKFKIGYDEEDYEEDVISPAQHSPSENPKYYSANEPKKKKGKLKWIIIGLVIIVIIGAAIGGGGKKEKAKSAKSPKQSTNTDSATDNPTTDDVPAEYKSALSKAESYSEVMHMSKQGIYDQLTSEYGEKFAPEAAQYAIDNMEADWNANALAKAKDYQETMSMSTEAIRDQLTSEYGEKFTPEEADYAISNLE